MSDVTNELLRLSEMRDKGQISEDEFQAAKAKLLGDPSPSANDDAGPPEAATVVMSVVPAAPPLVPPAAAAASTASKEIPPGIAGWSWGAFLWNWIWAIFNNTWIGLLALVPGVNLIMIFVLGAKGREWAWKNKQWDSVEHFNRVQRKWSLWGIWLVLGSLALGILLMIASFIFMGMAGSKMSDAMDANSISTNGMSEGSATSTEPEASVVEQSIPETVTEDASPALAEDAAPVIVEDTSVNEPVQTEQTTTQDDGVAAEQDRKHQEELAKTRAEVAAAKAEAAKAKKEALKAEKALAEQRRLQEEERLAQELAEQERQVVCPYSRAQPLTCSSRQGQPAYCDWNFKACGMPRLLKKESKTTCDGKMQNDPESNQIIVVDGCRGKFIPEN
ncbi:MAG: SHOCT domain-containing protein [Arenimonas sp.]